MRRVEQGVRHSRLGVLHGMVDDVHPAQEDGGSIDCSMEAPIDALQSEEVS